MDTIVDHYSLAETIFVFGAALVVFEERYDLADVFMRDVLRQYTEDLEPADALRVAIELAIILASPERQDALYLLVDLEVDTLMAAVGWGEAVTLH